MANALNLTLPLKQDTASQQALAELAAKFATTIQPAIDKALRESRIVHFARVLVIDNKYLQVITEYDGDHRAYTEFFRKALPEVFAKLFSLAEGAPPFDTMTENVFLQVAKKHNIRSLGEATDGSIGLDGQPAGYLFSAYDDREVKEVLQKLGQ